MATLMVLTAAGCLAVPTAAVALTLGPTSFDLGAGNSCVQPCEFYNHVAPPGVALKAPAAGVITRWSVNGSGGTFTLRIIRQSGTSTNYSGVATGPSVTVGDNPATVTSTARLAIAMNDQIGVETSADASLNGPISATGWTALSVAPPLADGGAPTPPTGTAAGAYYDINADVEPDSDSDGFGDDSQDRCVGTPGSDRGCPPGVLNPQIVQVMQVVQVVQAVNPAGGAAFLDPSSAKLSKDRRKLSFGVSCPAQRVRPCRGSASAQTTGRVTLARSRVKKAILKLGSATFNIGPGHKKAVTLLISAKARRTLKRLKRVSLELIVTESQSGQKTF